MIQELKKWTLKILTQKQIPGSVHGLTGPPAALPQLHGVSGLVPGHSGPYQ